MRKFIFAMVLLSWLTSVAPAQDSSVEPPEHSKVTDYPSRFAYVPGYRLAEWLEHHKAAEQKDKNASYYHVGKSWGFIAGVVDARSEEIYLQDKPSMKQIIDVVDAYLVEHADRWHEPAAQLVIDALIDGFPTVKNSQQPAVDKDGG